ncbi:MAG: DNA translocase FtsK 4TM domain-containing protein, partial [Pseudomonadota bacterium]
MAVSHPDYDDEARESLLPASWSAWLRRRAAELTGLALALAALGLALTLATHHPDDPSFFNATSQAPRNALGLFGAWLADPLVRTLGLAAWGFPALLGAWGLRLALHRGEHRAWSRLILAPFAVLAAAAALAAHVPPADWPHGYGMGGLAGDGAAGMLVARLPGNPAALMPGVTFSLSLAAAALGALALGVDRAEAGALLRWLLSGLVWLLGGLARAGWTGLRALLRRLTPPRSARLEKPAPYGARARREPALYEADAPAEDVPPLTSGPEEAPSVLERIRSAARRIEPEAEAPDPEPEDAPRAEVARPRVKPQPSRRARAEAEPTLDLDGLTEDADWAPPPLSLLQNPERIDQPQLSQEALESNARMLEAVLDDYGIRGEIVKVSPGPVVTMYELEPAPGLKASRVIGLADDIARSMSALAARVSTVPGRSIIGIELPNDTREKVLLREIFAARAFGDAKEKLLIALGKDIEGAPVVANLSRMPHLLIAGTTGSGKSVAINVMILSILYRLSPKECRMIMIDPKMLELS